MSLQINNLHVEVEGKEIIKGVSLTFEQNEIHALMGPNGSGKSTLAQALAGNPKYNITKGTIIIDGKDSTKAKPEERAHQGLFLSFQYPPAVPGVSISTFLRTAVNARREQQSLKPFTVMEFHAMLLHAMKQLKIDPSFSKRHLNDGFSGGEKKRMEILQMVLLAPRYALLDETDSGLDVDALKIVAESINQAKGSMGIVVITHYNRFLEFIKPDRVSVLSHGIIVASGREELAKKIEEQGFEEIAL